MYDGEYSLQITGDGSGTLTSLLQEFDSENGTLGTIGPQQQVSYCVWARRDGTVPAAGVWEIALVDENGVVVKDENGVNNLFIIDLTLLSTVFTPYETIFQTPAIMPASLFIRTRLSTALTNGRSVYFDKSSLGFTSQVYQEGPCVS